ncbi:flavin reductase family protein [Kribbella qitaiheensis]|uniref:Flavin reductase family protein n=1 Tax=Kribbella qitaiheensis TaxID=1544730 RepID=A0A7G6X518_9ACTN|nr:flavin reductase family protein [Kribbella qitaiheensis]QNE21333.1 flavin reductase family protein [Kribbella qitaiheensis]
MKRVIEPRVFYFGTPVVLISTLNEDGTANLAPMSSAWWLSGSAMLGLDQTSQTTLNLLRHGQCVLNLVDSTMAPVVNRLALLTGTPRVPQHKAQKGYTFEAQKFKAAGLTPVASDLVDVPRAAECPIQLEAAVLASHSFGGADSGVTAFEVGIVRTHIEEDLVVPGRPNYIDPLRWDPLIMKFTELFGGGSPTGESALARGWDMPPLIRAAEPAGTA